jgi:hypothetical protein
VAVCIVSAATASCWDSWHYRSLGSLGHSSHLPAGLAVVGLVLLSAGSATQINVKKPWARSLHIGTILPFYRVSLGITHWLERGTKIFALIWK